MVQGNWLPSLVDKSTVLSSAYGYTGLETETSRRVQKEMWQINEVCSFHYTLQVADRAQTIKRSFSKLEQNIHSQA